MDYILEKIKKNYSSKENFNIIEKAYKVAKNAHCDQVRLSGEPYFVHPYEVANILIDLGLDLVTVAAGLLHDVMEDTDITDEEIIEEFGEEVHLLVDGVTKLTKVDYKSREEREAESFRKMFLAMAKDVRVILIKLADRLHNMRTLKFQSREKQILKARETMEIYARLAHRLGISTIKWELEDLALMYLEPEVYKDITDRIEFSREQSEAYISKIIEEIKTALKGIDIEAEIVGRTKHIYSIYNKMVNRGVDFDDIYDKVAIRVIVDSVADCYAVMGILHNKWKPISERFKDYIAVPKKNDYKSIHTTLLGGNGTPFEVQIRTVEMHEQAEFGVAAHWKYKEGKQSASDLDNKIAWVRELLENENEYDDPKEFMESLKIDLYNNEVFVFTPNGDVKDFPVGATPIDFAYRIHSEVGNKCTGAKVNEKIVPLTYELKTGDVVSIITSPSKTPSRDWLNIAKTHQAKTKIRAWFKKENKEENIIKGKSMLEEEAKFRGYSLNDLIKPEWVSGVFKKFMLKSNDDMFAAVGYGGITTGQVLNKLIARYDKENVKLKVDKKPKEESGNKKGKSSGGITVKGESGMLVRFSKCCTPVPGDDIIGYITRGRGVSVHRSDCVNVKNNHDEFEDHRLIEVSWSDDDKPSYQVDIQITAEDRKGLLSDITNMIFTLDFPIETANARKQKDGEAIIELRLVISNKKDLEFIIKKVRSIQGVNQVIRINK